MPQPHPSVGTVVTTALPAEGAETRIAPQKTYVSHSDREMPSSSDHSTQPTARVATLDDIPALVELINRAYVAEAEIVQGLRTDRLDLHDKISTANTWFLVIDAPALDGVQRLAGCVCIDCDGQRGHVGLLSVNPDLQGQGLGARLLQAAELHCQNQMCCPIIELDVVSVRTELFGFYEHMGFVRTGILPFPVEERLIQPAHLVVMQKRAVVLPPSAIRIGPPGSPTLPSVR